MPIIRAVGAERHNAAVIAANKAKEDEKGKAKDRLPEMGAYLLINNPNATQQRNQITLLTNAVLETVKGVV